MIFLLCVSDTAECYACHHSIIATSPCCSPHRTNMYLANIILKPSLITLTVKLLRHPPIQQTTVWSLHMPVKSLHNLQLPKTSLIDTLHLRTNLFSTAHILPDAWDSLDTCASLKYYPNTYVKGIFNDRQTGCRVMLGRYWLRFHMSLPRLKYNNNFKPLLTSDLHLLRDYLEFLKRVLGLSFETNTLTPTRVDLFRNIKLSHPVSVLIYIFSQFARLGRLWQQPNPEFYGLSYIRWANKQREIIFYDKGQQLRNKGKQLDGNWLREEVRFMNARSCCRSGFTGFESLVNIRLQHSMLNKHLDKVFRHAIEMGITSDDREEWGFAVSLGHLVYFSTWETSETEISEALYGDNYKISFSIEYTSKSFKSLEQAEKEQSMQSDL